ncbi:MAG: S41 family peptidase [Prevotella sp.]|nr:S41 family peptidase [Bacteroides sp.]MCM1365656.1 S41 family peptidase [Prevotella sp.]
MKEKRNISLILLPTVIALSILAGIFIGGFLSSDRLSPNEKKLRDILGLIQATYVDEIDVDSLIESAFPDLLTSLDPHSAYIPASELKAANEDLAGSFSGVGVTFQIIKDTVTVIEVIPGGPADKVGIQAGDRILKANDKKLAGVKVSNDDVFKNLRGEKGTKVILEVKRGNGKKPIKFDVIRGDIPVNSVDCVYMIDNGIGFIKISKFARTTYEEFFNALGKLKAQGAKKFVLDLRDNSGGYLDQAIYMANEFLPAGKTIVYTKSRTPENETIGISDGSGSFTDAELVILTNEYSASASEIFSGAIQDNDRGLIIGRRTFGKGLVQNQTNLSDGSAIRLTVARYFTPSGRSIQKEYKRGLDGKYQLDIIDRYNHGEFYNVDSIKQDKSKLFHTVNGRKVYGGGGIMPDIFIPEDTTGYSSYYINLVNSGLVQKFAFDLTDRYRDLFKVAKNLDQLTSIMPNDDVLIETFMAYVVKNGEKARWYYVNLAHDQLLRQIKAMIIRDALGYDACYQFLNREDTVVKRALQELKNGNSPTNIKK